MGLIAELRRRNVFRMAGLYLVGAWLVTQVAGTLLPMFEAPPWIARAVVILLAIGFLPALAFAWIFELTPEGIRRDADVPPQQSIAKQTGRRLDRAIIVVLALALGYFAVDKFVLAPRHAAPSLPAADEDANKSIAVLPFIDLSPGKDQEYFSDGMSEELLNALAKVKELKVAGRTSSFSFKGKNEDMRAIGAALGVANIVEGSVRKQGDKVRITAQLIQASNGFHRWSETYDGDLKDVFELQERIARAITDQLRVVLQGDQKTRLVPVATSSPEAYSLYLRATAIFNRRDGAHFADAIANLERAIELDPKFARAFSRLAAIYDVTPQYSKETDVKAARDAAQRNARTAIALDPTLAEPHAALALSYRIDHRYVDERQGYEHALALDPDDVTTNFWFGLTELMGGYTKRGMELLDRALAIDPMLPNALRWRAKIHLAAGDLDAAEADAQKALDLGLKIAGANLAEIEHARGNDARARELWVDVVQDYLHDMPDDSATVIAEGLFGDDAARARAVALIDAYLAEPNEQINWIAPYALLHLGEPDKALAAMQAHTANNEVDILAWIWSPQGRATRTSPAFASFARAYGLTSLWDSVGPPDLCRKEASGSYICE